MSVKGMVSDSQGRVDKLQIIMALILVLLVVGLGIVGYWLIFDDNPPAEVFDIHLYAEDGLDEPVSSVEVYPGGEVIYGMDWCKYTRAAVVIVKQSWVDEVVYHRPPEYPTVAPEPFCKNWRVSMDVPESLRPSEYTLEVTLEYEINPLISRNVSYEVPGIFVVNE